MTRVRVLLLCAWFVICLMAPANGQVTTATVKGTVTDPSGAAIPNASLKLENTSRGVSRTAVASADGRFSFDFVGVGTYQLTVSQSGFNNLVRSGLELTSGQVLELPLQLDVRQQSQSVEVSATVVGIDTSTAEQVATLNDAQVHDLPVAHLDWSNLLTDSPGITKPPFLTSLNSTRQEGSGVNINGLPSAGYNFTVDGTNNSSDMFYPAFNVYQGTALINTVNNDAIQELTTEKATAPAIVGGGMSGNINIVTKGGTNSYHGSLHEINEVSVFDARNQFLTARPRTTYNDYGGSIGMPILKNKLFFFGSFEGAFLHTAKPITGGVPSPYLISIAPKAYAPLFALFPSAPQPANNPTATTSQYFGGGTTKQEDNNGVYRFDYYINPSNILFMRWVRSRPYAFSPAIIAANPRQYFNLGDAINLTYTHSSARLAENTRVAINRIHLWRTDQLLVDPFFENVTFGWSSAGSKSESDWGNYMTLQEAVVYNTGKQTFQFGGIVERQDGNNVQFGPPSITYSNVTQFLNDTPSGMGLSLMGGPPPGQPHWEAIRYQYGVFLQDDVKLTQNLTLNLGVRYDYFTVPTEVAGRNFNRGVDPNNPYLGPGLGPVIHKYYDPDYTSIQPRIGLAYNLFGRGHTVLRAGFAKLDMGPTYYATVKEDVTYSGANGGILPTSYTMNQAQVTASALKYPNNANNFIQQITSLQSAGVVSSDLPVGGAINTHFPNPYSLQWMFGIQQTLPLGMTLEADYNGNRGLHETLSETVNLPDRVTGVAPYPTFGKETLYTPDDRSKYAALQMTLKMRLQHGLLFSSGFTYARVSSFGIADVLQQTSVQNIYNRLADWGPAPFDIRTRSVTHAIWDVPLVKWTGVTGRASKLALGGWQVSGVLSLQSGLPANITNAASGNVYDRPDASGISPYNSGYQSGIHQYLNPAAFVTIPLGSKSNEQIRPGNLGNDAIRLPGLMTLDATIAKSFNVTERIRLQFRADTFNTLNHTNLTMLVTTINNTSTFGQLTQATARTMQLGLRVSF